MLFRVLENEKMKSLSYVDKINIFSNIVDCTEELHKLSVINLGIRPSRIAVVKKNKKYMGKLIFINEAVVLPQDKINHT